MLLKLTGSSCSGKSTVACACRDVDGLIVHDFDEVGVPPAQTIWRQQTLERWICRVPAGHYHGRMGPHAMGPLDGMGNARSSLVHHGDRYDEPVDRPNGDRYTRLDRRRAVRADPRTATSRPRTGLSG